VTKKIDTAPAKTMELKEFIKSSIQAIVDACGELKRENEESEVLINPTQSTSMGSDEFVNHDGILLSVSRIDFELAVTVDASDQIEGGGKISVLAANLGGSGKTETKHVEASKIKFSLRVSLPSTKSNFQWSK
jgi:hypothetical protein